MRLKAHRVYATIRTHAACQIFERGQHADVFLGKIDRHSAKRARELQSLFEPVDGYDLACAEHESARDCELADWPASPYRNSIALFNLRVLSRHVTGGKYV